MAKKKKTFAEMKKEVRERKFASSSLSHRELEYVINLLRKGVSSQEEGKWDEAISCYQKAIELNPSLAAAYNTLGYSLYKKGQLDDAIAQYQRAIEINPSFSIAYAGMASAHSEKGQHNEAITYYQKALQIDQSFADAHWNLSHALLLSGNFGEGWKEYEWRWKTKAIILRYDLPQSLWDG
jgi:tetratricopeptide (TPR) repeat protein